MQTPLPADMEWRDERRKLLLRANRNGFFYLPDRSDGDLPLAEPCIEKLTWAGLIGADSWPVLVPGKRPTPGGNLAGPGLQGATNWPSKSSDPATRLFFTMASEFFHVFTKREETWAAGKTFYGATAREPPGDPGERDLRATDPATGRVAWERNLGASKRTNWSDLASTAGGPVFFADNACALYAGRTTDSELLRSRQLSARVPASPMTFMERGKQFVAVAAGKNVVSFALPPATAP